MRAGRCFFTGHRIMSNADKSGLQKRLEELIIQFEANGVYEFFTGGALGFDYIAGMAVLAVKEIKPHICLKLFLPCYGSERNWSDREKYQFNMLKSKCDSFQYVTEDVYVKGCMQKRNQYMADMCGTCVAFCKRDNSGTKKTMEYAVEAGCRVINLANEI